MFAIIFSVIFFILGFLFAAYSSKTYIKNSIKKGYIIVSEKKYNIHLYKEE